jgi:hypothetical protein
LFSTQRSRSPWPPRRKSKPTAGTFTKETVIELGQQLFRDACGPLALHLESKLDESIPDGESLRISDYSVDEDHPMRLIIRLQGKRAGCQWLLDQWAGLRALLARGVPWLAPDKLKAVRLLGCHPIDAVENLDVAKVYLASHAATARCCGCLSCCSRSAARETTWDWAQSHQYAGPVRLARSSQTIDPRPPSRPPSSHRPSQPASPIRRAKPIRSTNLRRTKPILMFRRPVAHEGMATQRSESIRRISIAIPAKVV